MKVRLLQRWNGIDDGPHEVGAIVDMPDYVAEYMIPAGVCTANLSALAPTDGTAVDTGADGGDMNVDVDDDLVAVDVTSRKAADAIPLIESEASVEQLMAWRAAEAASKNRTSVLAAIDARLAALAPTDGTAADTGADVGSGSET